MHMKRLTFIDKKQIGRINFEAYIVEDENKLEAFVIYFQDYEDPILMFQQEKKDGKVDIKVNTELVKQLQNYKSKNINQRKEQYKEFKTFVLESEYKAKIIAFQDRKLDYITDVQLIKSIEQAYLLD